MSEIQEPILLEQRFNNSIKDVWEALTNLDQMIQWYFPNIPAFKAEPGFKTQFVVRVEDRVFPHVWVVTEAKTEETLAYEWTFDGYPGKGVSLFQLREENNQTVLTLTFTVLEAFPQDVPEFTRESGLIGWNYFIKDALKTYMEKQS